MKKIKAESEVAKIIKELRNQAGYTKRELSEKIDLRNSNSILNYENERTKPTALCFLKTAHVCEAISMPDLNQETIFKIVQNAMIRTKYSQKVFANEINDRIALKHNRYAYYRQISYYIHGRQMPMSDIFFGIVETSRAITAPDLEFFPYLQELY